MEERVWASSSYVMSEASFLIAGLGNPGEEYGGTRHNAGFMLMDAWCERGAVSMGATKFQGEFGVDRRGGRALYLLKPQTFMNLSGRSVAACMTFYHMAPSSLIVLHDDLDLSVGDVRVKIGGGSGGHNGLKSIISLLGSDSFARIRIGIGRPVHDDVIHYVLGRIPVEERALFDESLQIGLDALRMLLDEGSEAAMRFCNGRFRAKKKESKNGQS